MAVAAVNGAGGPCTGPEGDAELCGPTAEDGLPGCGLPGGRDADALGRKATRGGEAVGGREL